jgi:hypothetical protein
METERKSLYVESTIPSYATARESANALNLIRRAMTRDFWDNERHTYHLYVSQAVIDECGKGDPEAAGRRLNFIDGIERLGEPEGLKELVVIYRNLLGIPDRAMTDCTHLAYCVLHCINLLLTWNCKHLGSASNKKAWEYNSTHGLWTPLLVTPETIHSLKEEHL